VAVDGTLAVLPAPSAVAARIGFVVAGVALNAVATAAYIGVHLGPGPRDGLMTGLVARTGGSVRLVRTAIEASVVLTGWLLGGTLGLATVVYALAIGPLVHFLMPKLALQAASRVRSPARTTGTTATTRMATASAPPTAQAANTSSAATSTPTPATDVRVAR
jgi:uncharacterized membrane protein YczE